MLQTSKCSSPSNWTDLSCQWIKVFCFNDFVEIFDLTNHDRDYSAEIDLIDRGFVDTSSLQYLFNIRLLNGRYLK